jgi:hypothetical protein
VPSRASLDDVTAAVEERPNLSSLESNAATSSSLLEIVIDHPSLSIEPSDKRPRNLSHMEVDSHTNDCPVLTDVVRPSVAREASNQKKIFVDQLSANNFQNSTRSRYVLNEIRPNKKDPIQLHVRANGAQISRSNMPASKQMLISDAHESQPARLNSESHEHIHTTSTTASKSHVDQISHSNLQQSVPTSASEFSQDQILHVHAHTNATQRRGSNAAAEHQRAHLPIDEDNLKTERLRSAQSVVGIASARNLVSLERRVPNSNVRTSMDAPGHHKLNIELDEVVVHSANSSTLQRNMKRRTSNRRQVDEQLVHAPQAALSLHLGSASDSQNLVDPAVVGDVAGIKFASLGHRMPESNISPSGSHFNQTVQVEIQQLKHSASLSKIESSDKMSAPARHQDDHLQDVAAFKTDILVDHEKEHLTEFEMQQGRKPSYAVKMKAKSPRNMHRTNFERNEAIKSPHGSNADALPHVPPPPFDEEDLKIAKRREERAAARAARRK